MRNISFMLTTQQVRDGTKDVTRRLGWWNLKPGTRIMACEKCQGIPKGGKMVRIREIEIVSVRKESLDWIDEADVKREGFPKMTPGQFVEMFCKHNDCFETTDVNRIEFKYVDSRNV